MTGDTNWTPYSVPELAAILDDDLTSAWEQVGAWFSADAMLDDAASKLAEARTGLAAVWPPQSSPAAQTFFQVVDALTDSMKKTALAANTNANALSQVLNNHSDTKSRVDGLHSAWTANQKLAPVDPDEFPNAAQWQSGLNAQAQQHMAAADNVINEYASTLVVPPVIPVPGWIDPVTVIPGTDGTASSPGGGGGNTRIGRPGGGIRPPTGGGPRSPIGPVPPLPGVPILTGGGPPPSGGGPGQPSPGPGLPGVPVPPGAPSGPGLPSGPGGPGIPVPVIPGAPATPGSGGGSLPGKPRGGGSLAGKPGGGGSLPGEPGATAPGGPGVGGVPGRPGSGAVGIPGEAGFAGERVPGTGFTSVGGFAASSGGQVLGRDGTLRPGRSLASGPEFGGTEFGGGVGPTAADGTLRPGAASRSAYVDGPGATLSPAESSEGSISAGSSADGMVPTTGTSGGSVGRRRNRRRLADITWPIPAGGPAVLIPASDHDVHDPGPGVIGIDR